MRLFIGTSLERFFASKLSLPFNDFKKRVTGRVKWVKPENTHITYCFLGDVDEKRKGNLVSIVNGLSFKRFDISVSGLGAFPSLKKPRVIWLQISEGFEELKSIAEALYSGLSREGFMLRNDFFPHITIGRVKEKINLPQSAPEFGNPDLKFEISECSLIQSILTSNGPVYKTLFRKELLGC